MTQNNIDEQRLLRYLSGNYTTGDLTAIEQWISSKKENATWLFEMERIWSMKDEIRFSDKEELEKAYNIFISNLEKSKVVPAKTTKQYITNWFRYGAAAIILILLSLNIIQYTQITSQATQVNTIEVPKGQRASITLNDETKVWLNAGSKLTYPAQFSRKNRSVTLEGEGYFEVSHNKKSPFIVNSKEISVKVLGTVFNIRAYPEEPATVFLREGKVEVHSSDNENKITLKPNEQVKYSRSSGMILSQSKDAALTVNWISGELSFTEAPLSEIMKTLERKFDIETIIEDQELQKELFTCRAKADVTLEQVLNLLKDTRKLDYKIENKTVLIFKK